MTLWRFVERPKWGGSAISRRPIGSEGPFGRIGRARGRSGWGSARASIGILLAYEDLNGNGTLDLLSASGVGGDRILGSSFDNHLDTLGAQSTGYTLFYVETGAENDARLQAEGYARGYNLLGVDGPVALSTPIPIELTGKPTLGVFICEDLFSGSEGTQAPCHIELPAVEDPPPEAGPRFGGAVTVEDGVGRIEAQLFTEGGERITSADVYLGTTRIPYDEAQQYLLRNAELAPGGTITITARLAGGIERTHTVKLPGEFTLQSPADQATVQAGTTLAARWTASSGADHYVASLDTGDFLSSTSANVSTPGADLALDASYTGPATFTVWAEILPGTSFPVGFLSRLGHSVTIEITQ